MEDTVRHEFDMHARRVDATDTRAGVLLGIAGLLVSLGADDVWPPLALLARLLAGTAAVVTLTALGGVARLELDIDVRHLARYGLAVDPVSIRLRLLHTRAWWLAAAHRRYRLRVARLRLASGLVITAVALTAIGATVEALT